MQLTEIRAKLKRAVSIAESRDPIKIARAKKYIVQARSDLPRDVLGAFFRVGVRGGVIFYKSDLDGYTLRYILSHELAHGVLGHYGTSLTTQDDYNSFNWYTSAKQEQEAHMFAACLLLDNEELPPDGRLSTLCQISGVPYQIAEKWHYFSQRG